MGLLSRHDVVVLDEVQSLTFDNPIGWLVHLKYLASGRYNRSGFADISSDLLFSYAGKYWIDEQLRPRNEI